jgi:hypothetical protein
VQHVYRLISHPPFLGHSELVLDLTGVGRPVADLFQAEGLRPVKVSITAGDNETVNEHGIWHVAKLLLVSTVQAQLHDGRLQIQKDLPEAPILKLELEDFRATVTDSGRWTFGARSGAHDDLVLALALALWRACAAPRCMSTPACWRVPHCCAPATTRSTHPALSRTVPVAGSPKEKLTCARFNPPEEPSVIDASPAMAPPEAVPQADSDDLITLVKLVLSHMHHNAVGAARWTAFNSGNDALDRTYSTADCASFN